MINLNKFILFFFLIKNNDFFWCIPFISEYFIGILSIVYLVLCCFIRKEGWNMQFIFNFSKLIQIVFCSLICFNANLIYTTELIYTGSFFGEYLFNSFFNINIKLILLFMFVYIYAAYQTFIKNQGKNYEIFIEFVLWLLGIFFFLLLLVSVYDLICMFFLIIGLNICFYGLLIQNSILKKNLSEVCLKYFLLSALSSIFIGGGCLFIFYICGTTNFLLINNFLIYKILFLQSSFEILIIKFGIFLLFFGFLFKLSLVPAHFWAPEVYEGLPTALLALINLPIKFVFSLLFLRLLKQVFHIFSLETYCNFLISWEIEVALWIISILSMFWGGINAVFEQKIKRFLAYSSINQLGFLIIGLLGMESSLFGMQLFLYFLIIYICNLWIFIAVLLGYEKFFCYNEVDTMFVEKEVSLVFFTDLKKLFKAKILFVFIPSFLIKNQIILNVPHVFTFFLCGSLFSFAGIPPLPGFFAKFYVLLYAWKLGYFSIVFIGIILSLVSAFYYLRILRILFLEKSNFESSVQMFLISFQGFWINSFLVKYFIFNKIFKNFNFIFLVYLYLRVFIYYFWIFLIFLFFIFFCCFISFESWLLFYCKYIISDFALLKI